MCEGPPGGGPRLTPPASTSPAFPQLMLQQQSRGVLDTFQSGADAFDRRLHHGHTRLDRAPPAREVRDIALILYCRQDEFHLLHSLAECVVLPTRHEIAAQHP